MQTLLNQPHAAAPANKSAFDHSELEELCNSIISGVVDRFILQQEDTMPERMEKEAVAQESIAMFYQSLTTALMQMTGQAEFNYWHSKDRNQRKVEEALAYIDEHFEEDFGLAQVTDIMHCSSTYLNRLLKQYTGNTFYNLLTQKRIERSKQLLVLDGLTVNEISSAVGYTNVHSFIRAFKRSVGVTPGQFRETSLIANS
ncbi:helix-turn-helix transcriptional regulator [Paenibacillus silvisoli]|uniref:helix-turn-helix transcriptional regulator n=1 Tax=Paenibacillus silvisoli TaxID=3110539 RepID=UPI002803B19A|nr:AraC family transcriptional regulator [Paenibacillus silvisoli]